MTHDATTTWLRALDDGFAHPWESLTAALDGIDDDEAAWQPPAYRDEAAESGWPLPGAVAWHVAHVAHCKRYYAEILEARSEPGVPDVQARVPLDGVAQEIAALREAHDLERAAVAALTSGDMDVIVGHERRMTVSEFLAMAIRHDTWHAAQIVVVRRLYRNRST